MLATILVICGASVFTSCAVESDNPATPDQPNLAKQMVGKWLYVEADGQKVETNELSVTTFYMEGSTLKAKTSQSLQKYELWIHNHPTEVAMDGNKITLTTRSGNITVVEEMTNISVDGDDLRYTCKYTVYKNGEVFDALRPCQLHCIKVHDDYSQKILGRWEGIVTSDEPGFEPQLFCEEYLPDGTNIEYELIDGQWTEVKTEYAEYFIDANLLCTRWKYPGKEEERENSVFISYTDDTLIVMEMVVRNNRLYTDTNTLKKVQPIVDKANVEMEIK